MTVHCASRKHYEGKHEFNPYSFKSLKFLSFAYIHSKRRKLGNVYPLSEMPICLPKQSKLIRHQFANFLYFQFLPSNVTIIKRSGSTI